MSKEHVGSVARTLLAAGSGVSLGLLVDYFQISPESLEAWLALAEKLASSLQGVLSVLGIIIAQGWSLHQKMKKSKEINTLKLEKQYND